MLEELRKGYIPSLPMALRSLAVLFHSAKDLFVDPKIRSLFPLTSAFPLLTAQADPSKRPLKPLRVGVVFSGGQAAGGHNVISGLFDALPPHSHLLGFLDGPAGIISGKYKELTQELVDDSRNQGGFDLIGSGRSKIETDEQFTTSLNTVRSLKLDGLVIIGGDDSNTNAALLAEYFLKNDCPTKVIGVPKTIDGDLKNSYVPISFGFDTACKTYSETIGNIAKDALSAKKYYHFIRLMGRSASHIALECALVTQPNLTLIGEEISHEKKTLQNVVQTIRDLISARAQLGKRYGIILVPEGLIEFIPEIGSLIKELNAILATSPEIEDVTLKLTPEAHACFSSLPQEIQKQLLLQRDPHGNVQVSFIETEKLLIQMLHGQKDFNAISHFLGYEGRAGFPSNFDCTYCYSLGKTAAQLIAQGFTGYMCAIQHLDMPAAEWQIGAVPMTALMGMEIRKGKEKPVIQKALVDLKGTAFTHFAAQREKWALQDHYRFPGPIQFFGPPEITETVPYTLRDVL